MTGTRSAPPEAPDPGWPFAVYRVLTALAGPFLTARARRSLVLAGVEPGRTRERLGLAGGARPDAPLVWFHAVSVGESLSILGLVRDMGEARPDLRFLITTVSATSARLVADRLPPRSAHQFAPVDTSTAVRRFLDHWHPDLAVFVESEIWPRLILGAAARDIPLALVNARLSDRSLARWRRFGGVARALFGRFHIVVSQNDRTATALAGLGIDPARLSVSGDLKAASDPPPVDPDARRSMETALGGRPVWAAVSTHPGEEEIVAEAVTPDALLILVPRHPERGDMVEAILTGRGHRVARRSRGEMPVPDTDIYLADTLGETGLWYSLAPVVFLGGSFTPVGGHNPFEPAQLGAAVLHGPLVGNFAETYGGMDAAGATAEVADGAALAASVTRLLADGEARAGMTGAAAAVVAERQAIRREVMERLLPLLPQPAGMRDSTSSAK